MTLSRFSINVLRSLNYKSHLSFYFFCIDSLTFDMEKIYHGYMTKNADGTNNIIGPG